MKYSASRYPDKYDTDDLMPKNEQSVSWVFDQLFKRYAAGEIRTLLIAAELINNEYTTMYSESDSYLKKIGLAHELLNDITLARVTEED